MKKLYIVPETNVYKVNVHSSMMVATSFTIIDDDPTPDSDFELSREDNTDNTVNHSNVWDNIW